MFVSVTAKRTKKLAATAPVRQYSEAELVLLSKFDDIYKAHVDPPNPCRLDQRNAYEAQEKIKNMEAAAAETESLSHLYRGGRRYAAEHAMRVTKWREQQAELAAERLAQPLDQKDEEDNNDDADMLWEKRRTWDDR